jgi:hypothetical protein
MNDNWTKIAKALNLDLNTLCRDGLTDAGKINALSNTHPYMPVDDRIGRDALSLFMEMAWSARGYERREGLDGKYLSPWLAAKLDAHEME